MQLDIVVVFKNPDVSTEDAVPEAVDFDCGQGGSAHRGILGPFGLLVHADNQLTEQTAVFFYISLLNNGHWATLACSDQSRFVNVRTIFVPCIFIHELVWMGSYRY